MKKLLFIPLIFLLSGCLDNKSTDCPACPEQIVCPEPIVCPECPPPTEVIKEVPVEKEVIKEVIVEKEVIKEIPIITEVIKLVEKIVEVPVEVVKTVIQPAPKYKYTINQFTFTYDKTKKYKLEIVSGVAKLYENDILIKTQIPDKTEKL